MTNRFGYNEDPDDQNVYIEVNKEGVRIILPASAREGDEKAPAYAQLATAAAIAMSSEEGCLLLMEHLRERMKKFSEKETA